jgi:hypothetical protein
MTKNSETTTAPVVALGLSFNDAAMSAFLAQENRAYRFRMETREGNVFIRPTYREMGKLTLVDFIKDEDTGAVSINLLDTDIANMIGGSPVLEIGETYAVKKDRYGWFMLSKDTNIEGAIENAEVNVISA